MDVIARIMQNRRSQNRNPDGPVVNSHEFLKIDLGILIVTVMYYAIGQFKINENYSSGYQGIWIFFTFEHIVQVTFQLCLLLSDWYHRKTCVLSLRSGAFFMVLGMFFIVSFLGLLSIWLIAYFCIVQGAHAYIFMRALQMRNDTYLLYRPLQIEGQSVMSEVGLSNVGGNNNNGAAGNNGGNR